MKAHIVGGGFGGLYAAKANGRNRVELILPDKPREAGTGRLANDTPGAATTDGSTLAQDDQV